MTAAETSLERLAAAIDDKPCLVGWLSGRPDWNRRWLEGVAAHAMHLGDDWTALQGGAFSAAPLKALLATVTVRALGEGEPTAERAGRALAQAWHARNAIGLPAPTLVLTATRLGTHTAVPFVFGDPEVAHRLFDAHRPVAMLGHDALVGEAVIDAMLASCAIPGVFPPVVLPVGTQSEAFRTFVDGAVAENEPFHLAIDAGATFIVSLEVSSGRSGPPSHRPKPFPALAAEAFMTVQDRGYATELREVARWNRRASDGLEPRKQVVPLFRLAPHRREIGLLDFDGRWEDGQLVCSLYDWFMAGYADAGGTDARLWANYLRGVERHGDAGWALNPRPPHAGFWEATHHPFGPALEPPPSSDPLAPTTTEGRPLVR
jgi:predicted acylesterase/phospholipase RssA